MGDFKLLDVYESEGVTHATLLFRNIDFPESLSEEFEQLSKICEPVLKLDLRSTEFLGSAAIGSLVRLNSALKANGKRLTILVSDKVLGVFRLIRLTSLFEVVSNVTVELNSDLLERLDEWCNHTNCNRTQAINESLRLLLKQQ